MQKPALLSVLCATLEGCFLQAVNTECQASLELRLGHDTLDSIINGIVVLVFVMF